MDSTLHRRPSSLSCLCLEAGRDVEDCYDYLGLNVITEPLAEPLPHIDTLLDKTRGAQQFTTFDLAQGYHQVRIREADW